MSKCDSVLVCLCLSFCKAVFVLVVIEICVCECASLHACLLVCWFSFRSITTKSGLTIISYAVVFPKQNRGETED